MSNKLSKSVEDNLNRAGRPKGVGNKSTGMAREAIARFVDGNASKMEEWLQSVAYGIQATDKEGNPKYSSDGNPVYVVPPNPEKAFGMLQAVMEYHVPKLARTEVVGDATAPITHIYKWQDD
jgi:hypothetical protein